MDIAQSVQIAHPSILVLGAGKSRADINQSKGHLFERFIALLLEKDGFSRPTTENLNVTSSGVELDISTTHSMTGQRLVCECKAYSTNLPAKELATFYGKLAAERFGSPGMVGFFIAIPGLVAQGKEKADKIRENDSNFKYLNAMDLVQRLLHHEIVTGSPDTSELHSDYTVVVSEHGIFSAAKVLNSISRGPEAVRCWGKEATVPDPVVELLQASEFAEGLAVLRGNEKSIPQHEKNDSEPAIVTVSGASQDFEYQLPAAPKLFVGRRTHLKELDQLSTSLSQGQPIVLNGQSGWGKSSLALRFASEIKKRRGYSVVYDTRTASSRDYVRRCLQQAVLKAEKRHVLTVGSDASFGSLPSIMRTLARANWSKRHEPILIFFDQFENVFRDSSLTREFRDLAFLVRELPHPLIVGFSWKTDFVTWAEYHPYRLRDDIRASSRLIQLDVLGPTEISTLLRRLEKALGIKLHAELKRRLREYSQGLPWLFKKLASHVIAEISSGSSQEVLLEEALNVKSLFESDLAELSPEEVGCLRKIARVCPVPISEIVDVVPGQVVQSLIDRRLIVSIGEFLDTYWDIFRDFLNTGEVPIKESYILRQAPSRVGRLLKIVKEANGRLETADAVRAMETTEGVIFNLSRELRLLGVFVSVPGNLIIAEDLLAADNFDDAVHNRVSRALRRNQGFDILAKLLEDNEGGVGFDEFVHVLPSAFPGVEGSRGTWKTYARAFLKWFEYARLVTVNGEVIQAGAPQRHVLDLLGAKSLFALGSKSPQKFPESPPRPALEVAKYLDNRRNNPGLTRTASLKAFNDLRALGIARYDGKTGDLVMDVVDLFDETGQLNHELLRHLMAQMPGASEALEALERNPSTGRNEIGKILGKGYGKEWSKATLENAGSYFRAWASYAGVNVIRATRKASRPQHPELPFG